jgi:hypothetical protein
LEEKQVLSVIFTNRARATSWSKYITLLPWVMIACSQLCELKRHAGKNLQF